jgi:hypothetical protein
MAGRGDTARQERVACGRELLVRGLMPGSYWFGLSNQQFGDESRSAFSAVDVASENVEAVLPMAAGATVTGQLVMATSDAKLPPTAGLRLRVAARESGVQEAILITPDAEGRFVLRDLWPRQFAVLTGLDARYYVQQMRLNGAAVQNGELLLNAGVENRVEIVVSDQAATLTGTVTWDGPTVAGIIFLQRIQSGLEQAERRIVFAGAGGLFQAVGLPPGEYHVLAIPGPEWVPGTGSEDLTRLLSRAQTVRLDPGGRQNVTLKVTDPSR